jgi:hypothetical protein
MSQLDLAICSIPRMSLYYPPSAPAVLKSMVNQAGFSCMTYDFVIRFHNRFFYTSDWDRIDNWLAIPSLIDPEILELVKPEVEEWARDLVAQNPRWIGISVFSYESHKLAKLLCMAIKKITSTCRIVLGGMGISDDSNMFAANLKLQGLCDEYILGDGEDAIINLLKDNHSSEFHRIQNLDQYPFPNWEDYDLNQYKASKTKQNQLQREGKGIWQGYGNAWYRTDEILTLPIIGSRGCVRKCSFCDIPALWPKYQTRTAENIAQEIIMNYEQYGVQRFHFTDSLINGNMKNFRKLAEILANYRTQHNADFTMTGQFIVRSHASETDHDYAVMSAAGFKILEVGTESGSEAVRWHMGKKFTNEDLDIFMERVNKNGIMVVMLLIVGYPTETQQDFQDTLDMLTRYKPYLDSGSVVEACLGGTMRIDPISALSKDPHVTFLIDDHGKRDDLNWSYQSNPDLTLKERIRRRLVLMTHAQELGYLSPTNNQEILYLQSKWKELQK